MVCKTPFTAKMLFQLMSNERVRTKGTMDNVLDHKVLKYGRFHRGGIIQGVLLYTMTPWQSPRKYMGEWDYRTRIIPLLSSMKPGNTLDYS
jgi:hypothetical protein